MRAIVLSSVYTKWIQNLGKKGKDINTKYGKILPLKNYAFYQCHHKRTGNGAKTHTEMKRIRSFARLKEKQGHTEELRCLT